MLFEGAKMEQVLDKVSHGDWQATKVVVLYQAIQIRYSDDRSLKMASKFIVLLYFKCETVEIKKTKIKQHNFASW